MSQRWDRDRYERERYGLDRDNYSRAGDDRFAQAPRRTTEVLLDERRRDGPRGFEERDRYIEEDRYLPARRPAPSFLDEPIAAETSRQALAPYRRPRPQIIRKQSSLDTFDRRPQRRYDDEYRLPANVPIPLPIRRPASPGRERYFEEVEERYRDSDEEYRDVRVNRGSGRSRSRKRSRSVRRRRSLSNSSFSSVETKTTMIGRRGRTKVPKRLAHRNALIELGYPFVEEDNFIVVQRALDKPHIDRIVEISKKYREDTTVTYAYNGVAEEEKRQIFEEDIRSRREDDLRSRREDDLRSRIDDDIRSRKEEIFERETIGPVEQYLDEDQGEIIKKKIITTTTIDPPDHHHRHQDLAVAVPRNRHQSEHDIRREIKELEAEAEALRLERKTDRDLEEDSKPHKKDIYRVERNRKGRMALIRSAH